MTSKLTELIERVKPQTISAREARRRLEELRIVAACPDYQTLGVATIVYVDAEGNYYRVDRGRKS